MQTAPNSSTPEQSHPTTPASPTTGSAEHSITLDVGGMKCAGCVRAVENQLNQCSGVVNATVNLVTEMAIVECDAETKGQVLADRLTDAGFPSQVRSQETTSSEKDDSDSDRQASPLYLNLAIAAGLLALSTIGHLDHIGLPSVPLLSNIWFHWGLATLALLLPGREIITDGWRGLRHGSPNMNTLVGLGTVTAYSTSVVALLWPQLNWECFFDEPVMLVGFIVLGRTLEQRARRRAASAFKALLALRPTVARLITDTSDPTRSLTATVEEVPADQVQLGQWLQVRPGDKIPVDGDVILGQTTVNESILTGESLPVSKQPGDPVIAGSLNQSGAIAIKATRIGAETTLSQIIQLVETAQTRKAPIQRLADTVAGYFTYGIIAIATLTFLFWFLIGTHVWPTVLTSHLSLMHGSMDSMEMATVSPLLLSLKLAIAVLVIACPCALGLATPTAILVGSGIGAEQGLLVRGGDVLETVHRLTTVVFDKTGTLTVGQPTVTDCVPHTDLSGDRLLQLAATVEYGTHHPISDAITTAAKNQALDRLPTHAMQTEVGSGVSAEVDDRMIRVGTAEWLTSASVAIPDTLSEQADALAQSGKTVVYVAEDDQAIGVIAVADTLRSDAQTTVERLQHMGLTVMLMTGDRRTAAAAIAQSLSIPADQVLAGIRPGDKAQAIAQLQNEGQQVAMIGDGINDAPSLAQANVGISLHSSTEVAIETAEIILMRDRLTDVVAAIDLSKATFNKIRQNLFWAFAYNIIGIPLAMGVLLPTFGILLSPPVAGALMAMSSVTVVSNSLLLYRHPVHRST